MCAEGGEELVVAGDDHEVFVPGRKRLVRNDLREGAPLATGHEAAAEIADELGREQRQRRFVEGELQGAPGAGSLALEQRGEHTERRPDAGAEIDQRDADAYRRSARFARHAHDPRRGLQQRVVARLVAQRAACPERADRAVHESRVARSERGGVQAVLLCRSRPEALDEHVGLVGEAKHDVAPSVVGEVERERALAGVRGEEERAFPLDKRRSPGAGVVAGERLDLHDVGTQCRQ